MSSKEVISFVEPPTGRFEALIIWIETRRLKSKFSGEEKRFLIVTYWIPEKEFLVREFLNLDYKVFGKTKLRRRCPVWGVKSDFEPLHLLGRWVTLNLDENGKILEVLKSNKPRLSTDSEEYEREFEKYERKFDELLEVLMKRDKEGFWREPDE